MDDLTREAIEDLRRRVAALEQVPPNPFAALRDTVAKMRPSRPAGEENDVATVTDIRKMLADFYLDVHDENLAMQPTLGLLRRVLDDYRALLAEADDTKVIIDHSKHDHPKTPAARAACRAERAE